MKGSDWIAANGHLKPGPARSKAVREGLAQSPYFGGWCTVPYDGGALVVSCDYVSIGEPGDAYRVPLDAPMAQEIADAMGAMLPTTRISDLIWKRAKETGGARAPQGLVSKPEDFATMQDESTAIKHNKLIGQHVFNGLWAGHKKDVVLSNRLLEKPESVAIYGFHMANGSPIQPESTKHEAAYYDYSHGVRLVQRHDLDGNSIEAILATPGNPLMHQGVPLRVFRYGESSEFPGETPTLPGNGGNPHIAAREIIRAAWKARGVSAPTLGELQYAQAVALGESSYGDGFPGLHNWGAILCPSLPPCGPGCALGPFDSQVPGGGSKVCVKVYDSDVAGATDMIRVLQNRPDALAAMLRHDLDGFVTAMGTPPVYSMAAHNNPSAYKAWLLGHLKQVAKGLSEPLAVTGGSETVPLGEARDPSC